MGSKGSNKTETSQTQQYTPDPMIRQAGYQALSGAQSASQAPFQMPQAPVAGFNPFQQQAFNQIQGAQGMAQPYFDQGQQYLQQSAQGPTAGDVNSFYNPMAANVTAQMQNIFGQQQQNTTGQLTQAAGGVGADRIAVGQANLANQQGLAAGQTYAGLYQQALQAAQQQKQMEAGAGYGLGQMGAAAQASYLQGTSALGGAGNQQQQLAQAQMNAPYQQQLAQIAYPFQTSQYLAGITGGLAPALGGVTSGQGTTTTPTPSAFSQILGAGTAGIGLLGASGAFGGGSGKGGGSNYGSTYGATDNGSGFGYGSYGGVQVPTYFKRGGRMAMGGDPDADSGDPNDQPSPFPGVSIPKSHGLSPVPYIPLQSGSGQSHNNLNLTPAKQDSGSSGGSGLGDVAKIAATVLPFFLARGGSVSPYDMGQHFDEGGDVDPEAAGYFGDDTKTDDTKNIDVPYETGGIHNFTMGDVASRAADYYSPRPLNPDSPMNVKRAVSPYLPQPLATANAAETPAAQPTATPPPYSSQPPLEANYPEPTPAAGPTSPVDQGNVPMPQARPDIAGPAGQGNFSPETPPLTPQQIAQETMFAANKYGIPQDIALRLVRRESGFRNIRGAAGEYGPTQLMPGTAKEMGVSNPSNTYENIHGGMQYLKKMYDRYGNWNQAVAAYNAGPNNVDRGRIPASTRAYVADVNGDGKVDVNDLSAREQHDNGNPYGGSNRDMSMTTEQMPRSQQPYPDATSRDWGQNAVRSPWMSLVKAGAAMAQSVGPIGSVIGKGLSAGAGELESQRKDLRSEEDVNNKAGALYQQAKQHLNQYQRMTPYQHEMIKAGKGNYQSIGKDPDTGEEILIDRRTGQFVDTGRVITPGTKSTALQSNIEWLKQHGIGKDDNERYQMAKSGVNDAATYGRLVQAEKKILAAVPALSGKSDDEIEQMARKNVTDRGFHPVGAAGAGPKVGEEKTFKDKSGKDVIGVWDGTQWKPKAP